VDDDDFIAIQSVTELCRIIRPGATSMAIRKAIVGMLQTGHLRAEASTLSRRVVPLEDGIGTRDLGTSSNEPMRRDFWRPSHAIGPTAERDFAAGDFSLVEESTTNELPYAYRKIVEGVILGPRVERQEYATGVTVDWRTLESSMRDRQWGHWGANLIPNAMRVRGIRPRWQWDDVKARLTVHAANQPEIVLGGAGAIVEFMDEQFAFIGSHGAPDHAEMFRYAQLINQVAQPSDLPPAD
jgi:hypothetical protein